MMNGNRKAKNNRWIEAPVKGLIYQWNRNQIMWLISTQIFLPMRQCPIVLKVSLIKKSLSKLNICIFKKKRRKEKKKMYRLITLNHLKNMKLRISDGYLQVFYSRVYLLNSIGEYEILTTTLISMPWWKHA